MKFLKSPRTGIVVLAGLGLLATVPIVVRYLKQWKNEDEENRPKAQAQGEMSTGPANKAPRLINLLPDTSIALTAHGHVDDAHFAEIFQSTWDRIPPVEAAVILAYWHKCQQDGQSGSPLIEVVPKAELVPQGEQEPDEGCTLRFEAESVRNLADDALEVLIAKELIGVSLVAKAMEEPEHDGGEDIKRRLAYWDFDSSKIAI